VTSTMHYRKPPRRLSSVEEILSRCSDETAVRFIREIDASGELKEGIDKIIEDGIRQKKRALLEKKRADLVAQLQVSHMSEDFAQERAILEKLWK